MASLRDVLNNIGKRVAMERDGNVVGEGLGTRRGSTALLEARLDPRPGDVLRFLESGEVFRVKTVQTEKIRGRVDHHRVELLPL